MRKKVLSASAALNVAVKHFRSNSIVKKNAQIIYVGNIPVFLHVAHRSP